MIPKKQGMEIEFIEQGRYFLLIAYGVFGIESITGFMRELKSHAAYFKDAPALWDLSRSKISQNLLQNMYLYKEARPLDVERKNAPVSVLVHDAEDYGIAWQFFTNLEAAEKWLLQKL